MKPDSFVLEPTSSTGSPDAIPRAVASRKIRSSAGRSSAGASSDLVRPSEASTSASAGTSATTVGTGGDDNVASAADGAQSAETAVGEMTAGWTTLSADDAAAAGAWEGTVSGCTAAPSTIELAETSPQN